MARVKKNLNGRNFEFENLEISKDFRQGAKGIQPRRTQVKSPQNPKDQACVGRRVCRVGSRSHGPRPNPPQ